jgi:hypothetical protein
MNIEREPQAPTARLDRTSRWAPWWAYVLAIAPANMAKELALQDASGSLRAALTAAIVAAGIALVTAVHRASRERRIPNAADADRPFGGDWSRAC